MDGEELFALLAVALVARALLAAGFAIEAIGLAGLALVALIAAVGKVEGIRFRPSGASGVVLGLITWPSVFASRLQLQSSPVDRQFFWISLLCSFQLLVSMSPIVVKEVADNSFLFKLRSQLSKNLIPAVCLSLLAAGLTGFRSMLLVPLTALGGSILFENIFKHFPGSLTLGEASLVASGLSMYFGDIVCHTMKGGTKDEVRAILEIAVLGVSAMPWIYQACLMCTRGSKGISFTASIVLVAALFAPCWFWLVSGVRQHPLIWVVSFMMQEPLQRFGLCTYWLFILSIVPFLYDAAKRGQVPQILLRKVYHVLAVAMFVPALLTQAQFLRLAFVVAFVVFSLAEMIRIWEISAFGQRLKDFMSAFSDSRDSDKLVISHFSLLLGCAVPAWLHAHVHARPLAAFAGILSIGVGDTMASYIGYNLGSVRLGRANKKTVEGTLAGFSSLVVSCTVLLFFLPGCSILCQLPMIIAASAFAGLVEAYTSQLDNLFVPLVFYTLLLL